MQTLARRSAGITLAALALLLSGCMDLLQEIWLEADGSARFRSTVTFDTSGPLFEAMRKDGKDPAAKLEEAFGENHAELRKDPNVKKVEAKASLSGTKLTVVVEVEVKDAATLPAVVKKAGARKGPAGGGSAPGTDGEFKLEKLSNGNWLYEQKSKSKAGAPSSESARAMAKEMFKDAKAEFRVHAPVIVETNGTVSGDAAEWKFDMAKVMESPPELRAELATGGLPILYIAIGGGVVLLGGVAFVATRSKGGAGGRNPGPRAGTRRALPGRRGRPARAAAPGSEDESGSEEESGEASDSEPEASDSEPEADSESEPDSGSEEPPPRRKPPAPRRRPPSRG